MRTSSSLRRNSFGKKNFQLGRSLMVVLRGHDRSWCEPVTYYGFDADSYSQPAQEGLQNIFAGQLFRMAIPAGAVRLVFRRSRKSKVSRLRARLGRGTVLYVWALPSTPQSNFRWRSGFWTRRKRLRGRRCHGGANINCFACHAGVVNGQVVAGLGNNHINQSDP